MGLCDPMTVDLGEVLEDVSGQFNDVPGRYVRIQCAAVKGMRVRANKLLPDVFTSLVDYAIKHSNGPLFINIRMNTARIGMVKCYEVLVEDNGPGIPDEHKAAVFERKLTDDVKLKGSDTGLFLVKSLVDCYDGRVRVEDRVKGDHTKGARFVVMLPAIE